MSGGWQLRTRPFALELVNRFTIANSSRTTTPTLLVELERDGIVGYGEASMPPYLGETQQSAAALLARIDLDACDDPLHLGDQLAVVDGLAPGNTAAKAAFDIALHDWFGKRLGQPCYRLFGLTASDAPVTSFTIGIDAPDVVRDRVRAARRYAALKVKLGGAHDREMVAAIRDVSSQPLRVDVNQGWLDRDAALAEIEWLATQGVELVEQPMPKERRDDLAWLRARSPLPILADEGVQRLADVAGCAGVYDGINVKLMKCTGMREAHAMIVTARALGLKVMLGCMTETSCAIAAAAQLASLADWADLDGALLVGNDPFQGPTFVDGRVLPSEHPGIGVAPRAASD